MSDVGFWFVAFFCLAAGAVMGYLAGDSDGREDRTDLICDAVCGDEVPCDWQDQRLLCHSDEWQVVKWPSPVCAECAAQECP